LKTQNLTNSISLMSEAGIIQTPLSL